MDRVEETTSPPFNVAQYLDLNLEIAHANIITSIHDLCFATFPLPDNSAKQATGNWTGAYPGRLGDTASFSCNTWYIFSNGAGTVHTKYCDFGNTWTDMSGMNSKCVDQFLTSLGPLQLDQVNQNWNQYVTKDTKPWWRYHMGDERTVTGIYVRFNVDFYECHSANNLEVRVGYTDWTPENTNWLQSNALCTTFAGANCLDDCTQYMTLNCKAPLKGRILSIQKVDVAGYIYSTWDTSIPCEWNSGGFPSDLPLMHIWILFG
ncbi:unnamed protein product [Darwinula stevensoni]|uniref:Uncharacterized protein n=1 Tax=Darwinula stevensoni TaxID=69355 RepID=A0A7R9A1I4_9CRUS|nr:unnamed protein product [Darwinula stevensoni]CAG0883583.1 unnamed protein product [Darwinula stevensoni]